MVYDIYTLRYKHEFFSVWMLTRNILTDRSDTNLPVRTVSKWLGNDKMTSAGYILEEELRERVAISFFLEVMLCIVEQKSHNVKVKLCIFSYNFRIFQNYVQKCNIFHCVLFLSLCVWFSRVQSALECNRSMNLWQQHFFSIQKKVTNVTDDK